MQKVFTHESLANHSIIKKNSLGSDTGLGHFGGSGSASWWFGRFRDSSVHDSRILLGDRDTTKGQLGTDIT